MSDSTSPTTTTSDPTHQISANCPSIPPAIHRSKMVRFCLSCNSTLTHEVEWGRRYSPFLHFCTHCRSSQEFTSNFASIYYMPDRICWACDAKTQGSIWDEDEQCKACGYGFDGSELVVWVKQVEECGEVVETVVDMGDEIEGWGRHNWNVKRCEVRCEVCGEVFVDGEAGGLEEHERECKGEKKEEFVRVAREDRARPCVEFA